ncbi:MAG: DEAD/DEAH box helicase family protein [Bryobacteraceae bacterium]
MENPSPANSEWLTRKQLIDKELRAAGWRVTPYHDGVALSRLDRCAIEEYPTATGPADYALVLGGRVVGVVEAKKLSLGPQNVLSQAERYSKGVPGDGSWGEFGVPFLYSTNGEVIWYHDIRHEHNRSRIIAAFHTPAALGEFLGRDDDAALSRLAVLPNDGLRLRPYQRDANTAIEEALVGRKHHMLIAMATGTGKTFTIVNEIYRLMKSGVARRILFLVDRRALAAQAVRAFASFDAEAGLKFDRVYEVYSQRFQRDDIEEKFDPKVLPKSYLTDPKAGSAFVYVSTIQRMTINLFGGQAVFGLGDETMDDDAEQLDIPIHAFDLIVADECHRGYTSSEVAIWRRVLDHFDAIKIGLTATPAAHTTSYFKDVVYRYNYERAVSEGFLVDYDVITIKSNVRLNGVFLKEGEEVGLVNPESGAKTMDVLEDERSFETTAIEREITAPDSNKKILEELKTYCLAHEERTGRFPKTLIFAANDLPHTSHADQLVDQARDIFGRGDSFVAKITGSPTVDRPLQRIREFRNRPQPSIVVTVDMLSTGVDIPDLEFIVFLRPVKSRILFEQMLGRGTRKGEKYPDKSHFVVVDCFDGTLLQYFKETTGITAEPPAPPTRTITEIIESIWQNKDREYNTRCLVKRLQRIDKEMSGDARNRFAAYMPEGDVAGFAKVSRAE